MLGLVLYELHRDAVEYKTGIRAHLDALFIAVACTGGIALGSKVGPHHDSMSGIDLACSARDFTDDLDRTCSLLSSIRSPVS